MLFSPKDLWLCLINSTFSKARDKKIRCGHTFWRTHRVVGNHTRRHEDNIERIAREVRG